MGTTFLLVTPLLRVSHFASKSDSGRIYFAAARVVRMEMIRPSFRNAMLMRSIAIACLSPALVSSLEQCGPAPLWRPDAEL
jgi:hypothetical protein